MSTNHESQAKQCMHLARKADDQAEVCKARGWHGCAFQLRRLADTYHHLANVHLHAQAARDAYQCELAKLSGKRDLHRALLDGVGEMADSREQMSSADLLQLEQRIRSKARRSAAGDYRARLANLITRFPRFVWSKEQ